MSPPLLVVISGLPCTGKSTLAAELASRHQLLALSKDLFKELMFDHLGYATREQSKQYGAAAVAMMFETTLRALQAGNSVVLESTFRPDDAERIRQLVRETESRMIYVHCSCAAETIRERFAKRVADQTRHPGHVDQNNSVELERWLSGPDFTRLSLSDSVDVETSNVEQIDVDPISKRIAAR